ncbi:FMN-binding domain-containing protein [Streptosporangium subroseum]|uniref:FMN-binding domain-containing protein n=1 Tax=Streptosporangium subroseum TaxID=106412 RepID=A0A239MBS5_9ACTN|nr:FMN-binding protein [Streptosporangium subroseum]SNT39940.1 FMN-binding domain-containing protein [Streptosporangium subroseum]
MRRVILAVLVTTVGLVLLLSFKPHEITASADPPSAVSQNGSGSAGNTDASAGSTKNTGSSATSGDKVVTGDAADTRWGPVQVELVLSGGKVTNIKVLQAPDGNNRDIEINNQALPILKEEALSAQSAQIDTVSGATYTSDGYTQSLQSALDKAGL